jgi:hypothetical protein
MMELCRNQAYHSLMRKFRRFLMIALITLTALRGMVGDVMAMQMTANMSSQMSAVATERTASHDHEASAAQTAIIAMPCHTIDAEDSTLAAQAGECKTCQVCHLSAFVAPTFIKPLGHLHGITPELARVHFSSAEPLRLAKPPIL